MSERQRVPTAVWRVGAALILALDERLGPPVDSYVNGSQTWLLDDGSGDVTLEWRLHPVASYRLPTGLSHYDVWEAVVGELSRDADPSALALGDDHRALDTLWDGLECFPAYGEEIEPANLARAATDALGIPPERTGMVDHERIGEEWERSGGTVSIIDRLEEQLRS